MACAPRATETTTGGRAQARDLRSVVFHLLRRAVQEHTARWQNQEPELTKPQYAVLHAVLWAPGIEQAAVGQRAATDKATLAALLTRLERRGLLERITHPEDRRRRRLYLTEAGRELLDRLTPVMDGISERMLDRLTPDEQDELRRLLRKLAPEQPQPDSSDAGGPPHGRPADRARPGDRAPSSGAARARAQRSEAPRRAAEQER